MVACRQTVKKVTQADSRHRIRPAHASLDGWCLNQLPLDHAADAILANRLAGHDPRGARRPVCSPSRGRLAATVHDRMPVILNERDYDDWLSSDTDPERLRQLLVPLPDDVFTATPVSTYVNKPANQGPECIEPVG